MPQLPSYRLPDGGKFIATAKFMPETIPWPTGLETDDKIKSFVAGLWALTAQRMKPEHRRMTRNEKYYSGFHFDTPELNLENEITNYPFSIVETVWPELIEQKPRPQIQAGYGVPTKRADELNAFATWLMNTDGFDHADRLGVREMLKLGWDAKIISWDNRSGIPYPKNWCNWDFYPDFTAKHEDDMMYYFLAGPVPTRYLQSLFPDKAAFITPDNWTSPSYDALVRPYQEMLGPESSLNDPRIVGYGAQDRGFAYPSSEATPAGSTYLTNPEGHILGGAQTTFLIQLVIRDLTQMPVVLKGQRYGPDNSSKWSWDHLTIGEAVCGSGWRVIQMTAGGVLLDIAPLDPCYGGMNLVMGRDYEQAFRMFNAGEIDNLISKTRGYTRRLGLLNLALEYQCNPVAIADKGSGIDVNRSGIYAGELLLKNPGKDIKWLEFGGPTEQQFQLLAAERNDIDIISGVHDVQQGQRPPGIEAGVAIAELQQAALKRVRGKAPGLNENRARLLKKLMVCAGLKATRRIVFRATDGREITMDPELLLNEYDIHFAEGSGLRSERDSRKGDAVQLATLQALDAPGLLEAFDWPNRQEIGQRLQIAAMQQQQLQLEAARSAAAGTASGKPTSKAA